MLSKRDYDAIVVGARVAGAPTAMLLARRGYRVLLIDRARFPADTLNGYQLRVRGLAYLDEWGLLGRLLATGVPPLRRSTLSAGPLHISASVMPYHGIDFELNPRRYVLDAMLADAAVEAGAEFIDGFNVEDLLFDGDRVSGVSGRVRGSSPVRLSARIIVGADGSNSFVARTLGVAKYNEVPPMNFGYLAHWSGVAGDETETYLRDGTFVGVFPTHDGLAGVAVAGPPSDFHRFRADVEGNFMAAIDLMPGVAERLRAGRREDRFVGIAKVENFFRKPYGSGWALVGDAGYIRDPAQAQGMTDAFRDAEALADAIDAAFGGRTNIAAAMAEYHNKRDAAALPMYRMITGISPERPLMARLLAAVAGDQEETDRLFAASAGSIPVEEYFAPENIARILEPEAVAA